MLEETLHHLVFAELLLEKGKAAAVAYVQNLVQEKILVTVPVAMSQFSERKKIKQAIYRIAGKLLRSLVMPDNFQKNESKYTWASAREIFERTFCQTSNIPLKSPLSSVLEAGVDAAPSILRLMQICSAKKRTSWWHEKELPIEIPRSPAGEYHSVFTCPVSHEQATKENPPVMLTCGHAICRDSMMSIARRSIFKCPYCPAMCKVEDAVVLTL